VPIIMNRGTLYTGWQWRHSDYSIFRRHVGGITCCSSVTSWTLAYTFILCCVKLYTVCQ